MASMMNTILNKDGDARDLRHEQLIAGPSSRRRQRLAQTFDIIPLCSLGQPQVILLTNKPALP